MLKKISLILLFVFLFHQTNSFAGFKFNPFTGKPDRTGAPYDDSTGALTVTSITGSGAYALDLPAANVTVLGTDDSIATNITNASSGDTLILGSGTYAFSTFTISKGLKIIGQGRGKTILASSSTNSTAITINTNNVTLEGLSITQALSSAGGNPIFVTGTAGAVLTGILLKDVEITSTSTLTGGNVSAAMQLADANATIDNCLFTVTNSGTGNNYALYLINASTAETATAINIYNTVINLSTSTVSGTPNNYGIRVSDSTASQDIVVTIQRSYISATDSLAGVVSYAIAADTGSNAKIISYQNVLNGTDGAALQASSAVITSYSDTFVVNAVSGTITGGGTFAPNAISASSTITSSNTAALGWSVVAGLNTACNTTCTSACVVGVDAITTGFLACTDATADSCLCAGAS